MTSEIWSMAFFIGAIFTYWIMHSNSSIEDKSVYYQYCDADFKHNVFSCPGRTNVIKIEYKIFIEKQMVVSKSGNAYKNCAVFDKDNWSCDKGQGQTISLSDGQIYESSEGSIDEKGQKSAIPRYNQIWAITYYIRSIIEFFR